ncbi:MAG: dUTP diphosphatase [Clostridiales bacterium]|nr:dUTP diphosphatase [Clostridiales bacterium]
MSIQVKIKRISSDDGRLPEKPEYATPGSAAFDLKAFLSEPLSVAKGELVSVPTGIAIELPSAEYAAFVFARSGLATKHGICLSNGVGVIDSDYRGEIKVGLCNLSDKTYTIYPGDRIAQLSVMPVIHIEPVFCDELTKSERGEGGFGSTGR